LILWEAILPAPLRTLPAELDVIDKLLDDERFLRPDIDKHPTKRKKGRPTSPIETYLRLWC